MKRPVPTTTTSQDPTHPATGGLAFRSPVAADGPALWDLARSSGLDENSPYAYVMWAEYHAGTSVLTATDDGDLAGFAMGFRVTISGSHRWLASCVGETPADHHRTSTARRCAARRSACPTTRASANSTRRGQIGQALGPAGTVVFFECNVMHGSNGNISPDPRRNVFLVYNSVDNALEEPFAAPAPRPTHIASRTFDPV